MHSLRQNMLNTHRLSKKMFSWNLRFLSSENIDIWKVLASRMQIPKFLNSTWLMVRALRTSCLMNLVHPMLKYFTHNFNAFPYSINKKYLILVFQNLNKQCRKTSRWALSSPIFDQNRALSRRSFLGRNCSNSPLGRNCTPVRCTRRCCRRKSLYASSPWHSLSDSDRAKMKLIKMG